MGPYCNQNGAAEPLYARLREALGDPMPPFMSGAPVTWQTANCLSMCGGGPNLVVYPDEEVTNQLDIETLERIIERHTGEAGSRPATGQTERRP